MRSHLPSSRTIACSLLLAVVILLASQRGSKADHEAGAAKVGPATNPESTRPATRPATRPGTLEPGDLVEVTVNDLTGPASLLVKFVRVDKDGTILPILLRPIRVGGMTVAEAEEAIAKAYTDDHIVARANVGVRRLQLSPPQSPLVEPIQKLDLLRITVWELRGPDSEDARVVRLAPDGTIRVPYIGSQRLLGLSATQAEQLIAKAYLDQGIIRSAKVSVLRLEASPPGAADLEDVAVGPVPDGLRHVFTSNPGSMELPSLPENAGKRSR